MPRARSSLCAMCLSGELKMCIRDSFHADHTVAELFVGADKLGARRILTDDNIVPIEPVSYTHL